MAATGLNERSPCDFISAVKSKASFSFVRTLSPDPTQEEHAPNRASRQVYSGHYVLVEPTPIPNACYIAHSPSLLASVGISEESPRTDPIFKRFFSGDLSSVAQVDELMKTGWATGYALSIYGTEYTSNCPFRTGNGYGDGRAMSVLELRMDNTDIMHHRGRCVGTSMEAEAGAALDVCAALGGQSVRPRLEFQLKGGGRTPYCRGGDGRAVLRSSVREFLASECMYALGVPTARSLSLYASESETVMRPWYSDGSTSEDPDQMVSEHVAVTTRVAPSFIRVGQLELFSRRARRVAALAAAERDENDASTGQVKASTEFKELERLVQHLIEREYPDLAPTTPVRVGSNPQTPESSDNDRFATLSTSEKDSLYLELANHFAERLASLTTEWIRVGYCQGNFNADNCAAGGWTLDYGPFGFVEKFSPSFNMWVGGGEHFSFMNQPTAGAMNFKMFCVSIVQLLTSDEAKKSLNATLRQYPERVQRKMESMIASKMGLQTFRGNLWGELQELLQLGGGTDWTIFWRLLCGMPKAAEDLKDAFYEARNDLDDSTSSPFLSQTSIEAKWTAWLDAWKRMLEEEGRPVDLVKQMMQRTNPKFIPREWMLRDAYRLTENGIADSLRAVSSKVRALQAVLLDPYGEGTAETSAMYFRKQPKELHGQGGVSHCSCSS